MSSPYVFRTRPHFVPKVWGGRALETSWNKELPSDVPFGESWEVADLEVGQSAVANGPLEGSPLRDVVALWGADLVGSKAPGDRFPLLVKLLDAREDLSVQVHPGPEDLERHPDAHPKDEAWIILDSDDGSILHGFCEGVDASSFREALEAGEADRSLRRVKVSPGEVYRVRPGTVHAICAGVQLLEIQQPSDTTYRVWDYDRPGLDGKPRDLHLEEAFEVMRFEADPVPSASLGDDVELLDTPAYSIASRRITGETNWTFDDTSPTTVTVLEGSVSISGCEVGRGETAVIPASITTVEVAGSGFCVLARI